MPVAVETLGALGDGADELMRDLGRRISEVTRERRATEFLLQRLSVAIQCGNAASVLGIVMISTTVMQNLDVVYYNRLYNCVCIWFLKLDSH